MTLRAEPLLLRLTALAALLPLYYAFDWMPLRLAVRDALVAILPLLGHPAIPLTSGAWVGILLSQGSFEVTANCTYADLTLTLAPFVWRFHRPWRANAAALALLAPGVFALNLARLALAVDLHARGLSWDRAHHLPDTGLHMAVIALAVLLALRSDHRLVSLLPPRKVTENSAPWPAADSGSALRGRGANRIQRPGLPLRRWHGRQGA